MGAYELNEICVFLLLTTFKAGNSLSLKYNQLPAETAAEDMSIFTTSEQLMKCRLHQETLQPM